jgi:hypothetical protein
VLGVALAAGAVGRAAWRHAGGEWPGEAAEPAARTRFLAVLSILGALVFATTILWFWLAAVFLDPCQPEPRFPFAPSAVQAIEAGGPGRA